MDEIVYTPQKAAYLRWMEEEGIPIFEGLAVEDVTELPRKPWARMGGTGSFIQLKGRRRRYRHVRRRDSARRRAGT